jgi:dTDP-4-amino-4,6-dideoxygalactose transaminase
MDKIPFNKPHLTFKEMGYIANAHALGQFSGDGFYTKSCNIWFEKHMNAKVLLTHSCTAALEMSAILADIQQGDEFIVPSYTFVTTANAFVLRGGVPVFVDIREDTLNIDENKIEEAITPKTKAIVVVHYAGVSCEMDKILKIAKKHKLILIEDAAQAVLSKYKNRYLGTIGDLGTFSFHETKNIISGEGGALIVNNKKFVERAEIIREKGTNRSQFFRGQVDKYTWVDIGSSYLPGEVIAAFLYAQLENAKQIITRRLEIWNQYHQSFQELEEKGMIRRPFIPGGCAHNGHMYYILTKSLEERQNLIQFMNKRNIFPVFHYVPLHSSPAGKKYGRVSGDMIHTDDLSDRLLRMPFFYDITNLEMERVIQSVYDFYNK